MAKTITLIGGGKMALAIANGLKDDYKIELISRSSKSLDDFETSLGVVIKKSLYPEANIDNKTIILCVKPQNLSEISHHFKNQKSYALYSVLAGATLESLSAIDSEYYCRAMPNLSAEFSASMTSLVGDDEIKLDALEIFSAIGKTIWLSSEQELDIASALAGCGPAFLALVAEALCDGVVKEGLKRDDAMEIMRGLFYGFAPLIDRYHPAILKDSVMSAGGITAAGYSALEDKNVRSAFISAIESANKKSKELAKNNR